MSSEASVSKWLKLPFIKIGRLWGEDLGKDTKLVRKPDGLQKFSSRMEQVVKK